MTPSELVRIWIEKFNNATEIEDIHKNAHSMTGYFIQK